MLSFSKGMSYRRQIGLKLKLINFFWIWDQSGICGSSRLKMRELQRKIFKIKIMLKGLFLQMLASNWCCGQTHEILTQNWSLSALWIYFQNWCLIFRYRMTSFLIFHLMWNTLYSIISWGLKGRIWGKRGWIWGLIGWIWGQRGWIWGQRGWIWGPS